MHQDHDALVLAERVPEDLCRPRTADGPVARSTDIFAQEPERAGATPLFEDGHKPLGADSSHRMLRLDLPNLI